MQARIEKRDIPASAAFIFLAALVGALIYFKAPTQTRFYLESLNQYFEHNGAFVCTMILFGFVNFVWFYSVCSRLFTVRKQGKRLRVIAGEMGKKKKLSVSGMGVVVVVGAITLFLTIGVLTGRFAIVGLNFSWLPSFVPIVLHDVLLWSAATNVAVGTMVICSVLVRLGVWRGLFERFGSLPKKPKLVDAVVLGTSGEGGTEPVEWVSVDKRALNGNVLITGSIGSGKTQAAILPIVDEVLSNFETSPAILAIDPKGALFPTFLEMIEKHNLSNRVVHFKLGGDVKFNPIYMKDALRRGKFSDLAHMVRSAAANYNNDSGSSNSFWEISSFNLIRNALVYCSATRGYYTLNDLYQAMVRASEDSLHDELEEVCKSKDFDEEETFNIRCAIEYFGREFEQLDNKVRTSILATATSFLNQFQEYQAAEIFCPNQADQTIESFDSILEDGKIVLFDITKPSLARSMGTFVKLHFEQAVLNRLADPRRLRHRSALVVIDEYQDVVSVGGGGTIGDDRFLAKSREANSIFVAATQSLSSLESVIREKSSRELVQCFRTRIALQSTDDSTIRNFQELVGREEIRRKSHSVSEFAQHARRNLVLGGFEAQDANISESISTTEQKEYEVTGREFSRLETFQAFALVYDGIKTSFQKLFLKPYFLKDKRVSHASILNRLQSKVAAVLFAFLVSSNILAFPSVCSVAKTSQFKSCMDLSIGFCLCGFPPRPCAKISYYVPKTFIEVHPDPGTSYFGSLPGTAIQLAALGKMPFGAEGDENTQSFHAHTIAVPLATIPFSLMPCEGARMDKFCFDGMSEHLGSHWRTGSADSLQPKFIAWGLSPKGCALKGAATSVTGYPGVPAFESPNCSYPMGFVPKYRPSPYPACTGWGYFYPRYGSYNGPSQAAGSLMIGARLRSLSQELFKSSPGNFEEKWQMIYPQSSSCFKFGQNVGLLEHAKNVKELGRFTSGKKKGFLYVVWEKVYCCKDLAYVPEAYIAVEAMIASCKGLGGL